MAVISSAAIKKVVTSAFTNKKGQKILIGILALILMLLCLVILGIPVLIGAMFKSAFTIFTELF